MFPCSLPAPVSTSAARAVGYYEWLECQWTLILVNLLSPLAHCVDGPWLVPAVAVPVGDGVVLALFLVFEGRYREANGWGSSWWAPYLAVLPTEFPGTGRGFLGPMMVPACACSCGFNLTPLSCMWAL